MAKRTTKPMDLQEQAEIILARANERGVSSNFFFTTTFQRYRVQLQIMEQLEKEILESGAMVTKEYVKGRKNLYTNPAIVEYNRTATAANQTVATLINIVAKLGEEQEKGNKLQAIMQELDRNE